MERVSKAQALRAYSGDVDRTQRQWAEQWGVSVSTANAWIREAEGRSLAAEQAPNRAEHRPRTQPNKAPNRAEQATEHEPNTCRTCAEQAEHVREILATVRVLAKNYSKLYQELTPLLASLGEGAFAEHGAEQPNTEQAEHGNRTPNAEQPNTEHANAERTPGQLSLDPDSRHALPGPRSPLLNMLKGAPPLKLDGGKHASASAWLDDQWPVIATQVEADAKGEALSDREFYARARALMMRFWKNRKPVTRTAAARAGAGARRGVGSWQNA